MMPGFCKKRKRNGERVCLCERKLMLPTVTTKERENRKNSWNEVDWVRQSEYIRGPFTKLPHVEDLCHGGILISNFLLKT